MKRTFNFWFLLALGFILGLLIAKKVQADSPDMRNNDERIQITTTESIARLK